MSQQFKDDLIKVITKFIQDYDFNSGVVEDPITSDTITVTDDDIEDNYVAPVEDDPKEGETLERECDYTFGCHGPADRFMNLLRSDNNNTQVGIIEKHLQKAVSSFKKRKVKNVTLIDSQRRVEQFLVTYNKGNRNPQKISIGVNSSKGKDKLNPKEDTITIWFRVRFEKA